MGSPKEKQGSQKLNHDHRAVYGEYRVGETVMAKNYRDGPKWMKKSGDRAKGSTLLCGTSGAWYVMETPH